MGTSLRVGVIGSGAIGTPIIETLSGGGVPGCTLSRILTLDPVPDAMRSSLAESIDDLIETSDLVVEAAGHGALQSLGPTVIGSGRDLLVLSVGALADEDLLARLTPKDDQGRLLISTGALGGIDALLAAMLMEPLNSVALTSHKPSQVLVRPWMSSELREQLSGGTEETEAFAGPARDAVRLFPASANIAATLALATIGFDRLHVRIVGVPGSTEVVHRVAAEGRAGSYEFVFKNRPSESNPRTSAIAPFSVIRALHNLQARTVLGV
jgi:aspartate dehydrogenase